MEGSTISVKKEFSLFSSNSTPKSKINPKYYKQAYRIEWESMPDFKGWLKSVPGEPTRAYCTLCKKSLHAHRLSLLKHTCTLKHTKAAQVDFVVKDNAVSDECRVKDKLKGLGTSVSIRTPPKAEVQKVTETTKKKPEPEPEPIKEEDTDKESKKSDGNKSPVVSETEEETSTVPKKKMQTQTEMTTPVPQPGPNIQPGPLTTHVLDTAKGVPVGGLQVSLYKLIDGRWTNISEGITNPDGRYANFIQKADFTAGRYKLHYDVDRYFELRKMESLYPFIEVVFDVKSPQDHHHVPLLLSPFGYTTYRGS